MASLNLILESNMVIIIGVLVFINLFLFLLLMRVIKNIKFLQKKYDYFMKESNDIDIEELLTKSLTELREYKSVVDILKEENKKNQFELEKCVQKVGIVRFNAFDDTGSDLSYSVSLLDKNKNGVVLSSIFGRDENRCYAKPIKNGKSEYSLSEEELKAIN